MSMRGNAQPRVKARGPRRARMRRTVAAVFAVCGLAVTAGATGMAGASAAPAAKSAVSTVTIVNPNADGSYTGTSMSANFYDLNNNLGFSCAPNGGPTPYAVQASGIIPNGPMQMPTFPDAITSLVFNPDPLACQTFGLQVTVTTHPPYPLTIVNVPGEDSNGNPASADGYISIPSADAIDVVIGTVGDPTESCSFTVDGDATGWYQNATSTLHLAPDIADDPAPTPLTIHNPTGDLCAVVDINEGDTGVFWATDEEPDTQGMPTDPFDITPPIMISTP